jgi:hypothetical protein
MGPLDPRDDKSGAMQSEQQSAETPQKTETKPRVIVDLYPWYNGDATTAAQVDVGDPNALPGTKPPEK